MITFFLLASKIYLIVVALVIFFCLYEALPKVYQLEKEGKNWTSELLLVILGTFYTVFGMIATMFWVGLILAFFTDVAYLAWDFIVQLVILLITIVLIVVLTVGLGKALKKS